MWSVLHTVCTVIHMVREPTQREGKTPLLLQYLSIPTARVTPQALANENLSPAVAPASVLQGRLQPYYIPISYCDSGSHSHSICCLSSIHSQGFLSAWVPLISHRSAVIVRQDKVTATVAFCILKMVALYVTARYQLGNSVVTSCCYSLWRHCFFSGPSSFQYNYCFSNEYTLKGKCETFLAFESQQQGP